MKYNNEQYRKDSHDPRFPHAENREHFKAFYDELGKEKIQQDQKFSDLKFFFIEPKGRILELGSHWGFNLINWAQRGFDCVGVEVSTTLWMYGLEQIEKENKYAQERITFINGFAEDFAPQGKFDTIILTDILEHVMDPLLILKKAVECLKFDGKIYIASPSLRIGTAAHVRGITREYLTDKLGEAGLMPVAWVEDFKYESDEGLKIPITACIAKIRP